MATEEFGTYPPPYPSHSAPICIKVPQVIGEGTCQVMVVRETDLEGQVVEIENIKKEITIVPEESKVIAGKVIIDGILRKDITYKKRTSGTCGPVMYCIARIPFSCFVDVPDAMEGDDFQVESATVEGELDRLLDPPTHDPVTTRLLEKAILKIVVKVTRPVQITVTPDYKNICPPTV